MSDMNEEFELIEGEEEESALDAASRIKKLRDLLKTCRNEKGEYLEGWQRAKAELINYKKDEDKRNERLRIYIEDTMLHEFLTVLDGLDMALSEMNSAHLSAEARKGMEMIRGQFLEIMKRYGVEPIRALESPFDPEMHEALGTEISEKPEGTVIQELKRGYTRNGRVLRAAMVKTAMSLNP